MKSEALLEAAAKAARKAYASYSNYKVGACRQVLNEFCCPEFSVYIAKAEELDEYEVICFAALLPHGFHL